MYKQPTMSFIKKSYCDQNEGMKDVTSFFLLMREGVTNYVYIDLFICPISSVEDQRIHSMNLLVDVPFIFLSRKGTFIFFTGFLGSAICFLRSEHTHVYIYLERGGGGGLLEKNNGHRSCRFRLVFLLELDLISA